MKSIEMEGKTVDEAIMQGLAESGLELGQVDIEILDEGSKGFLSIGSRPARVRISAKPQAADGVVAYVEELLEKMGVHATVTAESDEEELHLNIEGNRMGTVIGRRGETLDAIQYLAGLQLKKEEDAPRRVVVDAENYRATREQTLIRLAENTAKRAKETGRKIPLEHMSAFERRVIHSALQSVDGVTTVSEGEGRMRHIVVVPE